MNNTHADRIAAERRWYAEEMGDLTVPSWVVVLGVALDEDHPQHSEVGKQILADWYANSRSYPFGNMPMGYAVQCLVEIAENPADPQHPSN